MCLVWGPLVGLMERSTEVGSGGCSSAPRGSRTPWRSTFSSAWRLGFEKKCPSGAENPESPAHHTRLVIFGSRAVSETVFDSGVRLSGPGHRLQLRVSGPSAGVECLAGGPARGTSAARFAKIGNLAVLQSPEAKLGKANGCKVLGALDDDFVSNLHASKHGSVSRFSSGLLHSAICWFV